MSDISTGHYRSPGRYEIRLKGHLEARWSAWFDGLAIIHDSDGQLQPLSDAEQAIFDLGGELGGGCLVG